MSARDWPTDALQALHEAMFTDAFEAANLPMLGAGLDAAAEALNAAGYRIVGPGELDAETVERCAEAAEGLVVTGLSDGRKIATAIRALAAQDGEDG